ncbi:hypothetical protein HPB47_011792 [Ixodes persulcatus]|uniref:Uncharacterized protein n=1 Tax=Ixodes persulcatus TaxID=34615 RepID=A0AC60NVB8_IXOPE|nr:hypothetical protein HPB47_011792 [Ixodes persulcatus]
MAAPLEPLSAQAGRKRFTIVEDILLLREVLAMNPFVNSSRWDTVAANLNEALGRNFSVRGVRDRCDLLLGLFKRDDRTNLRKELKNVNSIISAGCAASTSSVMDGSKEGVHYCRESPGPFFYLIRRLFVDFKVTGGQWTMVVMVDGEYGQGAFESAEVKLG